MFFRKHSSAKYKSIPDTALKIATRFEIVSTTAIPAASFVIIRRVSILIGQINVTSSADVSKFVESDRNTEP